MIYVIIMKHSKFSYILIESQLLPCTPSCGDIPSQIIQPWHHPLQNFFPWTPHEMWLKTKINLQFQLYWSRGTHFFRQRKFIQKQEIWASRPPILDPGCFRKSGFVKLKITIFDYKCTQVYFQGLGIKKSLSESQKMKGSTSFEPISVLLWHFQRDYLGQQSRAWKLITVMLCRKYLLDFWKKIGWNPYKIQKHLLAFVVFWWYLS